MGAPLGNQNGAKARQWSAAIERALERRANPNLNPDEPVERTPRMKALDALAEGFIAKLDADKDLGFYKELGDRLDGKPSQATEITGAGGGPVETVSRIERVIVEGPAAQNP